MLKQRCPILHISTKCHHWKLRISRTLASQFTRTGRRTGAARDHTTRGGWLERSDHTVIGVITAQCVLAENRWAGSAASRRCCQILNFSLGSFWYFLRWLFWPRCRSNRWKTKRHLRNQVKETNICNHEKYIARRVESWLVNIIEQLVDHWPIDIMAGPVDRSMWAPTLLSVLCWSQVAQYLCNISIATGRFS